MTATTAAATIALVGNPNTGKTTLFNALSGLRQRVGNYPGVTVEIKKGHFRHNETTYTLVDLPGTYSLAPRSPDEMVAVDLLLGHQAQEPRPDVVVTIVDASNLERNLYLLTQVLELEVPVVVALNMMDVAAHHGLRLDTARLSQQLGVPVVTLQANKSKGLTELKDAIARAVGTAPPALRPVFPAAFEQEVSTLRQTLHQAIEPYIVRRLLLDVGGYTEQRLTTAMKNGLNEQVQAARQRLTEAKCSVPAVEARTRYAWIREATAGCVERPAHRLVTWTDRLDRVLTHKVWGTLIFLTLMFVVFQSIFTWAKPAMDLIKESLDELAKAIDDDDFMAAGALRSLLADGIVKGVGGVLVFVPQIVILFAFIAILEDCGYMARAAFLMDRLMARCGLSGKSFIPLLSSVACAIPGIMAARVIEDRRDRLATILVAPLMSCSARLPVYLLLAAAFFGPQMGYAWWMPGLVIFAMYMIGFTVAPLVALALKRSLLKGETPVFVMEMPLYKLPSLRSVVQRMLDAGWMFLRRAGTIILASMILVWALLYFPVQAGERDFNKELNSLANSIKTERAAIAKLDENKAAEKAEIDERDTKVKEHEESINAVLQTWRGQSYLGRLGQWLEPVVAPLGWDWRLGVATLASFPAREVIVGTLGIIYAQGEGDAGDEEFRDSLGSTMRGQYSGPVALSVMVFFALCCQCASTLAVIRRETNSWGWPIFTFVYMTGLAYLGALAVYQIGSLIV